MNHNKTTNHKKNIHTGGANMPELSPKQIRNLEVCSIQSISNMVKNHH